MELHPGVPLLSSTSAAVLVSSVGKMLPVKLSRRKGHLVQQVWGFTLGMGLHIYMKEKKRLFTCVCTSVHCIVYLYICGNLLSVFITFPLRIITETVLLS